MHLKVYILVWVEVWEFLPFYFIYYTYMDAPPPPPSLDPPTYTLISLLSSPAFLPAVLLSSPPPLRACPCIIFRPSIPSLFPLPSPLQYATPPSLTPGFSDKNVIYTALERKGNPNRVKKRYLVNLKKNSILELNWKCFIGSATFLWTLRCVFRLVLRTYKRLN